MGTRFDWGFAITLGSTLAVACVTNAPEVTASSAAADSVQACTAVDAVGWAWGAYGDGCDSARNRGATSCTTYDSPPGHPSRAFVSSDDACNITLVYRGSQDFTDVLADVNWIGESQPTPILGTWHIFGGDKSPGVHPGVLDGYTSLAPAVSDTIARGKACGDRARVRIYGHSLGGSMGLLAHAAIRDALPNVAIHTETFGAPGTGNCDWASGLAGQDVTNHQNEHDMVWHMPPIGLGYCDNPGTRVSYEDDRSIPFVRWGTAHLPESYQYSANKACEASRVPPPAAQPVEAPFNGTTVSCANPRSLEDQCWSAIANIRTNYRRAWGFAYWNCGDYRAYFDEHPNDARDGEYWMCDGQANTCVAATRSVCAKAGMPR